jgi:hypothetical protein
VVSWLEDLDFASRVGQVARLISTDLIWGVHLGAKGGRTSGLRFGYSQVVNPMVFDEKRNHAAVSRMWIHYPGTFCEHLRHHFPELDY